MSRLIVTPGNPLVGQVTVPGDKSISHRALLLGALAQGDSRVRRALMHGDCSATLQCLRALGIEIRRELEGDEAILTIHGRGLRGFHPPAGPLDCIRSGTTMRLLCGILAGQPFDSVLTGDVQLLRRPMGRVVEPLRLMGASIEGQDNYAPLRISGRPLHGVTYRTPVASAQVKSALLLAGLMAQGATTVIEPALSRDHTERMLASMGATISRQDLGISVNPSGGLRPVSLTVPGDISSAAFILLAGAMVPGSQVVVQHVGLNPTRAGVLEVLAAMGAQIERLDCWQEGGEPVGDVRALGGTVRGLEIGGDLIPRLIDELPALAVLATQAEGTTVIRDAAELRVKETDRIEGIVGPLVRMGANIEGRPDGMIIQGPSTLRGTRVESGGDHRLAMALVLAGLIAAGSTTVIDTDCISDSYPGFVQTLVQLGADMA